MTAVHHPHQGMGAVDLFSSPEDKKIMREINSILLNFELPSASLVSSVAAPKNFLGLATALFSDESLSLESLGLKGGMPAGDYGITFRKAGLRIVQYVAAWFDAWMSGVSAEQAENQLAVMVEDVLLTVTVWYAVAGWNKRRPDQVMHNSFIAYVDTVSMPSILATDTRRLACTS